MRLIGIPISLTVTRLLLAPVVVVLALYRPLPLAFALCLVTAFLSDIFDGIIARRLGVATPALRRLDSAADTLFYAATLFAVWTLAPDVLRAHAAGLGALVTLELARYAFDFAKFRREASYHMWSSKLWGIALFVAFFRLLVEGEAGVSVAVAIYLGVIADIEGLLISALLPGWTSIVHAIRIRQADAPKPVRLAR